MVLLPSIASPINSNIADLLSKPLSRHRFDTLIGDATTITPSTSVASTVDSATVVDTATVGATATVVAPPTSDSGSPYSVPSLHPNLTLPIVLDTGASFSRTPFASDFLPVAQAPYGLFWSASASVASSFKVSSKLAPVDPCTLITGEDASVAVDLSSSDLFALNSDSVETASSFTKVHFDIRAFGTANLTFIYSKSTSELLHILVDPTQIDWIHWIPLPRLILPESYFHIFGLDYLQAFALFHLIPIWIALVSALLRSE